MDRTDVYNSDAVSYWIRRYYAENQNKKESINQQYAESMGCFGACVLLGVGLFLISVALMASGVIFESVGIPPVTICIGFPILLVIVILILSFRKR